MALKIEKGIPIPPSRNRAGKKSDIRLTLELLEVGDSFVVPNSWERVGGVISNCQYATGKKFVQRKLGDVLRIWRTE